MALVVLGHQKHQGGVVGAVCEHELLRDLLPHLPRNVYDGHKHLAEELGPRRLENLHRLDLGFVLSIIVQDLEGHVSPADLLVLRHVDVHEFRRGVDVQKVDQFAFVGEVAGVGQQFNAFVAVPEHEFLLAVGNVLVLADCRLEGMQLGVLLAGAGQLLEDSVVGGAGLGAEEDHHYVGIVQLALHLVDGVHLLADGTRVRALLFGPF